MVDSSFICSNFDEGLVYKLVVMLTQTQTVFCFLAIVSRAKMNFRKYVKYNSGQF